jgi:hypothetical protein
MRVDPVWSRRTRQILDRFLADAANANDVPVIGAPTRSALSPMRNLRMLNKSNNGLNLANSMRCPSSGDAHPSVRVAAEVLARAVQAGLVRASYPASSLEVVFSAIDCSDAPLDVKARFSDGLRQYLSENTCKDADRECIENWLATVDKQQVTGSTSDTVVLPMVTDQENWHRMSALYPLPLYLIAKLWGNGVAIREGVLGPGEKKRLQEMHEIATTGLGTDDALAAFRKFCSGGMNQYLVGPLVLKLAKGNGLNSLTAFTELLDRLPPGKNEAAGLVALLGNIGSLPEDSGARAFTKLFERLTALSQSTDKDLASHLDRISTVPDDLGEHMVPRLVKYAAQLAKEKRVDLAISILIYATKLMLKGSFSSLDSSFEERESAYEGMIETIDDAALALMRLPEFKATGKGSELVWHLTEMLIETPDLEWDADANDIREYLKSYGGDCKALVNIIKTYYMMSDYDQELFIAVLDEARGKPEALAELMGSLLDPFDVGHVLLAVNELPVEQRKIALEGEWGTALEVRVYGSDDISHHHFHDACDRVEDIVRDLRNGEDATAKIVAYMTSEELTVSGHSMTESDLDEGSFDLGGVGAFVRNNYPDESILDRENPDTVNVDELRSNGYRAKSNTGRENVVIDHPAPNDDLDSDSESSVTVTSLKEDGAADQQSDAMFKRLGHKRPR